jgi:hypothetical protein
VPTDPACGSSLDNWPRTIDGGPTMSEYPDARKELPPEIREFLIAKLAEILVSEYRQTHELTDA